MGKKVTLKAYVVYSPQQTKPEIFFGGVASSCASETAHEEGGFKVTLEGELDMDWFVEMWQEQVDKWKEEIQRQTTGDPKWRTYLIAAIQASHVRDLTTLLLDAEKELKAAKENALTS